MTSVAVHEQTNYTAPPSEWLMDDFVSERRKPDAGSPKFAVLWIGVMHTTDVDALPRRSLSYDPTSETDQIVPYTARAIGDAALSSATQPADPASTDQAAYASRLDRLRSFAEEDGVEFSTMSEHDFLDFACTEPQTRLASLVLLDNGNLRAVWRCGEQEVGVQFYGDGSVQYLISRESEDGGIAHSAQRGTFGDLSDAIEAAGLGHLLYE